MIYYILPFFCQLIRQPKRRHGYPLHVPPLSHVLPNSHPICQSRLNLIVVCICWISSHLRPRPHPSLSLFFAPIAAQNDRKESLPRVPPVRISYPTFLPPPTPPFGWLLRHPVKWRPSKVDAPPTSLFFDGCHFVAQNKGKESGENKPRPPAPA